jgi:hypothetical protein
MAEFCNNRAVACLCRRPKDHEGKHVCENTETCNAAWIGDYGTETFHVVRLPGLEWPT